MKAPSAIWLKALGLGLVAVLIPIVPFLAIGELPGQQWLEHQGRDDWSFAVVGAALLSADVFLPVPSSVVGSLMGGRLGFVLASISITFGLTLGHCIGFWLGRLAPKKWCPRLAATPSWWLVFLSRPVPIIAEAMTFTAGATGARFGIFFVSATLGNLAYASSLAAVGAALLPEASLGLLLGALLLLFAIPWWLWRRFASAENTP